LKTELNSLKAVLLQRGRLLKLMSRARPEDLGRVADEVRMRAAGVKLIEEMLLKINGQRPRKAGEVEAL
jgi:hypothetical protein